MSNLLDIVNRVRRFCDEDWLLDSQRAVFEALQGGFVHQRVLNVYGDPGVGKTVLAWVLERSGYGIYLPTVSALQPHSRRLLVDNFPAYRRMARRLIEGMDDLEISQVVVFTTRRIDDDLPAFEIRLTPDDMARCRANLYQRLDVQFLEESRVVNLHDLLRSATA